MVAALSPRAGILLPAASPERRTPPPRAMTGLNRSRRRSPRLWAGSPNVDTPWDKVIGMFSFNTVSTGMAQDLGMR